MASTKYVGYIGGVAVAAGVGAAIAVAGSRRSGWLAGCAGALIALNLLLVPLRHNAFAWGLFFREPDGQVAAFARSTDFEPGATYRILRAGDGKVGMYQLVRAGAQLDSEFFPESIGRRSWPSERAYATFLESRSVEYVLLFSNYDRTFGTNEGSLLETMAEERCATVIRRNVQYVVYRVTPGECGALP